MGSVQKRLLLLFVSRSSLRQARAPYRLRLPPGRPPTAGAGPPLPPGLSIGPWASGWFLLSGMRKGVRCRGCGRVGRGSGRPAGRVGSGPHFWEISRVGSGPEFSGSGRVGSENPWVGSGHSYLTRLDPR